MKQISAILLCAALALSLLGCSQPEPPVTEPTPGTAETPTETAPVLTKDEQAMEAYRAVLTGEEKFVDLYSGAPLAVVDGSITDNFDSTSTASRFTLVDLDGDGVRELILWMRDDTDPKSGFWVFRHQDGVVWGGSLTYRNFEQLKQDGTFRLSSSASETGLGRMRLSADGWYSEFIAKSVAEYDEDSNIVSEQWFVEGEPAESSDFLLLYGAQADKPNAVWTLFTNANLCSAGIRVTDAPEKALSSEEIQQKFIDILTRDGVFYSRGDQKATTLAEDCSSASVWIGAPVTISQAAAVDMDGDGILEVILQIVINGGNQEGVWVLHYQDGEVQGQHYYTRQLGSIKQDGSFHWSGSASNSGAARLVFGADWTKEAVSTASYDAQADICWMNYPSDDYSGLFH